MRDAGATLVEIAAFFLSVSLLAFGGVGSILPELHRQAVEVRHWMTSTEFAELYTIAQIAPGPNVLVVTLIGLRAGGIAGAIVATIAMIAPACTLAYFAARAWDRFRGSVWRDAIQTGLAPVTAGLVAAAAFLLARSVDRSIGAAAITAVAVIVVLRTKIHPLAIFAVAAILGAVGLV